MSVGARVVAPDERCRLCAWSLVVAYAWSLARSLERCCLSVVAPGVVFLRGVYCRPRVCGSPCPLVTGDGGLVALRYSGRWVKWWAPLHLVKVVLSRATVVSERRGDCDVVIATAVIVSVGRRCFCDGRGICESGFLMRANPSGDGGVRCIIGWSVVGGPVVGRKGVTDR